MLRRLARSLLLLVVILGITPGTDLLVEHVVEFVGHGHLAHSVPGEADPFAAEHGCSPAEQNCRCPHAQPSTTQGAAQGAGYATDHWLTWMLDAERAGRRPTSARQHAEHDRIPANRSTAPPTPPANA